MRCVIDREAWMQSSSGLLALQSAVHIIFRETSTETLRDARGSRGADARNHCSSAVDLGRSQMWQNPKATL